MFQNAVSGQARPPLQTANEMIRKYKNSNKSLHPCRKSVSRARRGLKHGGICARSSAGRRVGVNVSSPVAQQIQNKGLPGNQCKAPPAEASRPAARKETGESGSRGEVSQGLDREAGAEFSCHLAFQQPTCPVKRRTSEGPRSSERGGRDPCPPRPGPTTTGPQSRKVKCKRNTH